MKSPSSEKSRTKASISSKSLDRFCNILEWRTFSSPVNSGSNPKPNCNSVTLPLQSMVPLVGCSWPATILSRVDLPDPFLPTMPQNSPGRTSNDTSRKASNSLCCDDQPNASRRRCQGVGKMRYRLVTPAIRIAGRESGIVLFWARELGDGRDASARECPEDFADTQDVVFRVARRNGKAQ